MKIICILFPALSLVYSASAADLATCIGDAIQDAATTADVNFPDVISSVNSKCQASTDLLKCHRDSWSFKLAEHRNNKAYMDSMEDKLMACFVSLDVSLKCMVDSIQDPQGLINDVEAAKMRQSIATIRGMCDTHVNPASCVDMEFESIRNANRDYIDFYKWIVINLDANC